MKVVVVESVVRVAEVVSRDPDRHAYAQVAGHVTVIEAVVLRFIVQPDDQVERVIGVSAFDENAVGECDFTLC